MSLRHLLIFVIVIRALVSVLKIKNLSLFLWSFVLKIQTFCH